MRRMLSAALVFMLFAAGLLSLAGSRPVQLMGELVARVETVDSLVALTFDDGPTPNFTGEVLGALSAADVRATFFLVGGALENHTEEGRQIVAAGHEVGNHSYSHRRMLLRSASWVAREIERTDTLIRSIGYEGPIHFRAPYGRKLFVLPWYLWRTGRTHVMWDVAPESTPEVGASPERIVAFVLERVRPGSIVLLHPFFEARRPTLQALPVLIDSLHARGYRLVTVSELMAAGA